MEKEATALHLEVGALHLENQASCIQEEEAMVDFLVDCQEEEVAVEDRIQIQRCHSDRRQMVV